MAAPYLEKLRHLRLAIKQNGGIIGSFLQIYRTDELRYGDKVGEDKYGHQYYENKTFFVGRSRWVQYPPQVGFDYDGSQIPAEWHRWLHYTCDTPPTVTPPVHREWMIDHKENLSGTGQEYVPYSTTRPKIESWKPSQK